MWVEGWEGGTIERLAWARRAGGGGGRGNAGRCGEESWPPKVGTKDAKEKTLWSRVGGFGVWCGVLGLRVSLSHYHRALEQ